jgi:uncharacterized protein YxjI
MTTAARPSQALTHAVLAQNDFLVKEHVGLFKAANNFDLYDPATGQIVLLCREEKLGMFTRLLRFTDYKRFTPFDISVRTPDGELVAQVTRGIAIIRSQVEVRDGRGRLLGTFRQKLFSIGGAFDILDVTEKVVCTLKGKWTGWDFRFNSGATELAKVTKKWAGIGRELFTSADNYVISIDPSVPTDGPTRPLIVAAVLCIDMVFKE